MRRPTAFDPDAKLGRGVKLIEASAGTGKTYAITTLVVKLVVEERLPITEILVVTFTEAATAELRDRVRERLRLALAAYEGELPKSDPWVSAFVAGRRAAGEPDGDVQRLRQALVDFDLATISTIHGFCRRMLQDNAFESGARFDAQLLANTANLVDDIAADFWTGSMSGADEDLYRYLVAPKSGAQHLEITPRRVGELARQATADRLVRVLPQSVADVPAVAGEVFRAATQAVADLWLKDGPVVREMLETAAADKVLNKPVRDALEGAFAELQSWSEAPPAAPAFALQKASVMMLASAMLAQHTNGRKKVPTPSHPLFQALDGLHRSEGFPRLEDAAHRTDYF